MSHSKLPDTQEVEIDSEIFDRLFKLDADDVAWIKKHINSYLETCRRCLKKKPPSFRQALHQADEASAVAFAHNMRNIESKINFYRAHCYRGLGLWQMAYKYYMESTVCAQDLAQLQRLRALSKEKMEADKGLEVRRISPSENLRKDYNNDGAVQKRVRFA